MNSLSIKRVPTLFLKATVLLIGAIVFALCAFVFPQIYWEVSGWQFPQSTPIIFTALIGLFASPIPFFIALLHVFKLLHFIDRNDAFSEASIEALRNIKFSAIAMSVLYAMMLPLAYVYAEIDDAPGLILISTAIAGSPVIVATFAAVLQKLVRSAVDMKAEHDLIV